MKRTRVVGRGAIVKRLRIALSFALALVMSAALAQPAQLEGELQQGALVLGRVVPGSKVALGGHQVKVTEAGRFAIGFDRDAKAEMLLMVTAPDGTITRQPLTIAPREYAIQRIEGVPQRTVEPAPEALERIRREQALVTHARAIETDRTDFLDGFQWPLTGRISGVYGSQRVYNGVPGRPHYGVDIAAPTGTEVRAPAAGVVTLAHPDMFFSGGTLIMDHGHGVSSTFIHLSEVLVEEGMKVEPGDIVGKVGATGRATGPHLDWRINWFGAKLDPALVVPPMPAVGERANSAQGTGDDR